MLRYIISILFLLSLADVSAQLFDPLEAGRQPMIRLSIDPSLYARRYFQKADIMGFDFAIDSEVKQNLFVEMTTGYANVEIDNETFDYKSNGVYATLGANLNLTQYQNPQDRHIFYVGLHYGYGFFSHKASNISYINHWGQFDVSLPIDERTASWVELVLGIKAEAAKNLFVGWSAESKVRTHLSSGSLMPYYIAGYGKTANRVSLDFNIWLSYAFSFKPKKYESLLELSE